MSKAEAIPAPNAAASRSAWPLAIIGALLVWAYWPMLSIFADKWLNDPQYQHGLLVPFFSAFLIRRAWRDGPTTLNPMPILGCSLLVVVLLMRVVAGSLLFHQLDAASLLVSLAAVSIAAGGWPLFKRMGPAIGFLVFMIPLPYELERNVGQPLKVTATVCSTFMLQTFGQPALRDGNLILIDEVRLGVIDACSGLKMLMMFAAFSIGAVLLMNRSRFEKFMIVLGIAPVAILANVLRITATGMSYAFFSNKNVLEFLHDFYGLLMMPIGLGLLALELWALKQLVVAPEPEQKPALEPIPVRSFSPVPA